MGIRTDWRPHGRECLLRECGAPNTQNKSVSNTSYMFPAFKAFSMRPETRTKPFLRCIISYFGSFVARLQCCTHTNTHGKLSSCYPRHASGSCWRPNSVVEAQLTMWAPSQQKNEYLAMPNHKSHRGRAHGIWSDLNPIKPSWAVMVPPDVFALLRFVHAR